MFSRPDIEAELPDRLEKRHALDVADSAPNLDQHDVHVAGGRPDSVFDFVGDVWNDLYRPSEVVAAALLLDHRQIDLAGRPVAVPCGHHAREAFVVAQIQVRLRAVVCDVHLAVLVRAHGSWIDVDVGVELLQGHRVSVVLEESPDRRGRQPLAQ